MLEIGSGSGDLLAAFVPSRGVGVDVSPEMVELARGAAPRARVRRRRRARASFATSSSTTSSCPTSSRSPLTSQALLHNVRGMTHDQQPDRHPFVQPALATGDPARGARPAQAAQADPELGHAGRRPNLLALADFEVVSMSRRILFPKRRAVAFDVPNGFVANIWPLSHLSLTWWIVARPRPACARGSDRRPSRSSCRAGTRPG